MHITNANGFSVDVTRTSSNDTNGSATITDNIFGITLFVENFDASGHLVSVFLFGINVTFLF